MNEMLRNGKRGRKEIGKEGREEEERIEQKNKKRRGEYKIV